MSIKYIKGDLFQAKQKVIIHGCNAAGGFGSGFAGVVKKLFPEAADAYYQAYNEKRALLGSVVWVECRGILFGHCITQATYGNDGKQHVSYEAITACMKGVNRAAEIGVPETSYSEGFDTLSMPMIGSALGGGDWEKIAKIISSELKSVQPSVFVLPNSKLDVQKLPSF